MTIVRRLVFRLIVLALFASPVTASAGLFSAIYVVGDSLSDQGNLLSATTSGAIPGAPPLPDPAHYFQGRFSNGPVYTDLLSQLLGLPLGPSLPGGNNFAYGGARTTYNTVELQGFPVGAFPWSLNAEVADFKLRNVNDPNALYVVFSGANDVADILALGLNPATVIPTAIGGILNAVQAFVTAGAQTILVPNLPDLGKIPVFLNNPNPIASPTASVLTAQFNQALHTALSSVTGPRIIEFQTDDLFADLIANPAKYGLTNVTQPCYTGFVSPVPAGTECSTPDDFAFWDQVHPSAEVHRILAGAMLAAIPTPSTLWLGAACLLVLAWSRRAAARPAACGV